jgi:hypothetical protein
MCISVGLLENVIITVIIIVGLFALINLLLVPYITRSLGQAGATLIKAINIILACIILIVIVIVVFDLMLCLLYPHRAMP